MSDVHPVNKKMELKKIYLFIMFIVIGVVVKFSFHNIICVQITEIETIMLKIYQRQIENKRTRQQEVIYINVKMYYFA